MPGSPSRFWRKSRKGATLVQTTSSSLPSTLTGVAVRDTSYTGKSRDCAVVVTTVAETASRAINNGDSFFFIMMFVSENFLEKCHRSRRDQMFIELRLEVLRSGGAK